MAYYLGIFGIAWLSLGAIGIALLAYLYHVAPLAPEGDE